MRIRKGSKNDGIGERKEVTSEVTSAPPPRRHTHNSDKKSQRGGRDLIRHPAVHHTQGENGRE